LQETKKLGIISASYPPSKIVNMLKIHFIIISIEIIVLIVGIAVLWFYKQKWIKKPSEFHDEKWDKLKRLAQADYKCELCGATKNNNGSSFSEKVISGSRSYSFEVNNTIFGTKCLIITESGKRGNRQIEIFEDKFHEVAENLTKALLSLKKDTNEQFDEHLSVNEYTYFFDIKLAVNGCKYLTITSAKRKGSNLFERNNIIIFEDESPMFAMGLNQVINFIDTNIRTSAKRDHPLL